MRVLSPEALRAMFSRDSDDTLIVLLTFTSTEIENDIRLANNFTHRFEHLTDTTMNVTNVITKASSVYTYTADDVVVKEAVQYDIAQIIYGVMSNGVPYLFMPIEAVLPSEEEEALPRSAIAIYDVVRELIPTIRTITTAPDVAMAVVLYSNPDSIEAHWDGFVMCEVGYDKESITGELTVDSDVNEPFPCFIFTPSIAPGLF